MTALHRFFILLVVFVGLAPGLASAVQPDEILADSRARGEFRLGCAVLSVRTSRSTIRTRSLRGISGYWFANV